MDVQFHFTARSDVGLLRKNNQDSGFAGQHLLVLADGMGGPAGGDIASSVVVAHLAPLDDDIVPPSRMMVSLTDALQAAHDELTERSAVDPDLRGLGSTCIALLRSGNKMAMVHIGDSRAYLLRDGKLTQVTTDHSFVQYLVDTGQITAEEALTHPKRNVILKVVGDTEGPILADETAREAVAGDRWLLCSDGLSGVVSAETISMVMSETKQLDECADLLVGLALQAGAPDNVTVVMADVVPSTMQVPAAPIIVGAAARERAMPTRKGSGAAGKLASLNEVGAEVVAPTADEEAPAPKPKRKKLRWTLAAVGALLLGLLVGGAIEVWNWTQTQYYVVAEGGNVAIYRGVPQSLGPIVFSQLEETTDFKLDELSTADQLHLQEPVLRSSRAEVDQYLEELFRQGKDDEDAQSGDGSEAESGAGRGTQSAAGIWPRAVPGERAEVPLGSPPEGGA